MTRTEWAEIMGAKYKAHELTSQQWQEAARKFAQWADDQILADLRKASETASSR